MNLEDCLYKSKEITREDLIKKKLYLVSNIAQKFDEKNIDLEDLISAGTIGLIKGIDLYLEKPKKDFDKFLTTYIEAEISTYLIKYQQNYEFYQIYDKDNIIYNITSFPYCHSAKIINIDKQKQFIRELIDNLPAGVAKDIITSYFGFSNHYNYTVDEIISTYQLSYTDLKKILNNELEKIKQILEDSPKTMKRAK